MAIPNIDHLVIAVPDPDAAAVGLEQELGLAFTGGGRHATAGTWNRLAFLGDAYVELIGVYDRELALANPDFPVGWAALALLDAGREGLATWAVAVDDCAASVVRLRSEGSPIGDPVPGSRVRPDGVIIRWVTAFPRLGPEEPPFLIEHEKEVSASVHELASQVQEAASSAQDLERMAQSLSTLMERFRLDLDQATPDTAGPTARPPSKPAGRRGPTAHPHAA
jgi:Glyoxalase-like domain